MVWIYYYYNPIGLVVGCGLEFNYSGQAHKQPTETTILIIAKISEADLLEILDNPIAAIVPVIEDTIATDIPIVMLFIKQLTNCL